MAPGSACGSVSRGRWSAPRSPAGSIAPPRRLSRCSASRCRSTWRASRTTSCSPAARGGTPRPMTRKRRGWPRCSGRTSSSSTIRSTPRYGKPGRGRRGACCAPIERRTRSPAGGSRPVPSRFEIVRDPLWNNIRLDPEALAVVDTPAVQRFRYIRQLGHAFLVYPGATHSRFEHALGAYHLARRVLSQLEEAGDARLAPADRVELKLAALLHDIGHYPFSHALEEAGLPHHEVLAERHLASGELAERLAGLGTPPQQLLALLRNRGPGPP